MLWHVLDVSLDMPDVLDLTSLRGQGLQPGEEEMPDGGPPAEQPQGKYCGNPRIDSEVILILSPG